MPPKHQLRPPRASLPIQTFPETPPEIHRRKSTAVTTTPNYAALLTPFRRVTSSGNFIPEIDGLRFLAIASVFLYHLAGDVMRHSSGATLEAVKASALFPTVEVLNIGVQLFFTISGFILALPFATAHLNHQPPVPLKRYFLRRLTRLEPPYILSLICFFILKVSAGGRGSPMQLLPHFIASFFYSHNLIFGVPSRINFVAWSLEVEVQFYLLAPTLALLFLIKRQTLRRALLVGLIITFGAIAVLTASKDIYKISLLGNAQYFLAGFLFADIYLSGKTPQSRRFSWDLIFVLSGTLLLFTLTEDGTLALWSAPWLLLALVVASFRGIATNHLVTNIWITTIGGMCYTIYLLHNYLIACFGMITESSLTTAPFLVRLVCQTALVGPMVLVVSAIWFRLIERPCMRPDWPQRFAKRIHALLPATVALARAK